MNGRMAAAQALIRQERSGYANLVLDHVLRESKLPARERAFASRIFYGTVERQNTLDYLLRQVSARPLEQLDPPVRAVLRSGLYQARYMQIPEAVAVNESVQLVRDLKRAPAASAVNAILRRAVKASLDKDAFPDVISRLQVTCSVSQSVARLLVDSYGPAQAEQILSAYFVQRPVSIRVNTLRCTTDQLQTRLADEGLVVEPGLCPDSLLVYFSGSPAAHPAFVEGLFHVQGQASQFAAACLQAEPGQKVLDLCAAPGGKSLTLAQYMKNEGQLICCDAVKSRLPLIEQALCRGGVSMARIEHNDASIYRSRFAQAERVLCDVPCSGLGIIGKKPDIRYKELDGLPQLYRLQARILRTATRYMCEGGRLVYSTCTLNPHENEEQIALFLREQPQFACVPPAWAPPGAQTGPLGTTLLPHRCHTDGFFVAILEKRNTEFGT